MFRPTREEFQDPLNYIASISDVGRKFGICKIVPPSDDPQWTPPKDGLPPTIDDALTFRTKLQNVHQLKHRGSRTEAFHKSYGAWQYAHGILPAASPPLVDGVEIDLWDLFRSVYMHGGSLAMGVNRNELDWVNVLDRYTESSILSGGALQRKWNGSGDPETRANAAQELRDAFFKHLYNYEKDACRNTHNHWTAVSEEEITGFGYAQGSVQTLGRFREKAGALCKQWGLEGLSVDDVERLYWKIVDSAESRIVVEYGNDLSVVNYTSGFPSDPNIPMSRHPWNLNVLPKMPTSLFHHTKEVIHGVTDPMLYFGMTFSSFAWHVEDHFLYSINYHHGGAPKLWYGVGSDNADQLEAAMKAELPELFDKHPDLLHQLVTAVSPADLRRARIPVFKAVQGPGEFVVTFPRGYHGGFNTGFNVAEAVNFAQPDWIKYGVRALSNYSKTNRPAAFSHQELMLSVARSFPVSSVAVNLLQELYRLTEEYDTARHAIHKSGVQLFARGNEASPIPQCSLCMVDCYFACIKCGCNAFMHACLTCEAQLNWCRGTCQGKYLFERVPINILESLVCKLEARLDFPGLCNLSGCPDCPERAKDGRAPTVLAKAVRIRPPFATVVERPLVQAVGRRGGGKIVMVELVEAAKKTKHNTDWFSFHDEILNSKASVVRRCPTVGKRTARQQRK